MIAQKQKNSKADKDPMGLGWLIAAAVFFFNPCLNIIDILPDFFGCIFLIKGLRKMGDICPNISDALDGLEKLKWFLLFKIPAMLLVPVNDDTMVLVLTLGFTIIEMIYLYPAIGRIFDGLEYLGTRFQSRAIYKNYKDVSAITKIFCVSKAILTVLPELCSLSDYEYDGYVTSGVQIDFANYKSALLLIGLFLVTLIGVIWLINLIPYIKRIQREEAFIERTYTEYDEKIVKHGGILLCRSIKAIFALITAGAAFTINIWFDEMNVIPSLVGAVFILAAAIMLSKQIENTKPLFITSIAYCIFSALSYTVSIIFALSYSLGDISRRFEAYDLYNCTRIAAAFELIAQLAVMLLTIALLRNMIILYLSPENRLTDKSMIKITNRGTKELDRRFVISAVLYIMSFIANAALVLFRAEINEVLPEFWWIPLILTSIWVVYQKFSIDELYEQIKYKKL